MHRYMEWNKSDFDEIIMDKAISWEMLKDADILITGATGLIGKWLVQFLLYANHEMDLGCRLHALVRNEEKAVKCFGSSSEYENTELEFIVQNILTFSHYEKNIDYIIHGASQTSSEKFVNEPVETIETAFLGTRNMLELAREKKVKGFIYLSSMEIYGIPLTDEKITEEHKSGLDTMNVRNCYPIGKQICENLCAGYASEYGMNAMVIRLTQTFGAGVEYEDKRVFAEFARCIIEKRNIILHTLGETKRSYLYTADAVRAILIVLLKGSRAEAYNAANESTYCSIYEMACLAARECTEDKISVERDVKQDISSLGYMPTLHMNLDTAKIQMLGWKPYHGLKYMFERLCEDLQKKQKG